VSEGIGVFLRDQVILVATPAEAATRTVDVAVLAERWASGLRTVLASIPGAGGRPAVKPVPKVSRPEKPVPPRPSLTLAERRLAIPVGETRVVRVTGKELQAAPSVSIVAKDGGGEDPQSVTAELVAGPRPGEWSLTLRGLGPGRATVRLTAGDTEASLAVHVMPHAARIAGSVKIGITGRPAPASWVRQAAWDRREEGIVAEPGATIRWEKGAVVDQDLTPGETVEVTIPARVSAPGCLPVKLEVIVQVENVAPETTETVALHYSNNPERVKSPGLLYSSDLGPAGPVRLLYHHLNDSDRPLFFRVELQNSGTNPARAQVITGAAGPNADPVLVGHRAALRFWQSWVGEVGSVIEVGPGERSSVVAQRTPSGQTVSGLLGLRLLDGDGLRVRVVAEATPETDAADEMADSGPERPASEHVYPTPRKSVSARYRVGGPWTFIAVGQRPITGRDGARRLDGNYGVLYDIDLHVENPTGATRRIEVALSPDAGEVRGVFWIEGQIVEVPPLVGLDNVLASFELAAGEEREVPIRTIPVAGSSYPARIVIRSPDARKARAAPPP
jgi:hypothetical protein